MELGKVGNLFSKLSLGKTMKGYGPLLQFEALMQGSNAIQPFLMDAGLAYDYRKDPRVVAAQSYAVSKGKQFGPTEFNIPAKGQIARLGGKEVQWDGQKWVRTNIENIAQDPFGIELGAASQSLSPEELQQPAGQSETASLPEADSATGAGDPSYLTDAFKKALITRLFLQAGNQQSVNSFGGYAVPSLLESQRELGRSITG